MQTTNKNASDPSRFREEIPVTTADLDQEARAAFRSFLETHRAELETGMGAFHTDDHSNW